MKLHSVLIASLVLIVSCAATFVLGAAEPASTPPLTTQEQETLVKEITPAYEKADRGSHWWSVAFYGCLFGSTVASAGAALVIKLDRLKDSPSRNDVAACLAALAALLPLIAASGNFNQKWATNRATRAALSDLLIEVRLASENAGPAANDFARRYKDIMAQHERGIAPGSERTSSQKSTSTPKPNSTPSQEAGASNNPK